MQTTMSTNRAIAIPGLVVPRPNQFIQTRLLEGPAIAGYGAFRVPVIGAPGDTSTADPGTVYQTPDPVSAADVDAIITAYTTSTAIQTFSGTDLNGAVGQGEMLPPRKLTMVASNHADFNATDITFVYINDQGQQVTELVALADGGNETITTLGYARRVVSISIPAQAGTGGTATFGIAVLDGTVNLADFEGIAIYDASKEPFSSTYHYGPQSVLPLLYKGAIWVITEDACAAGAGAFVRVGGTGILGAIRSDVDTSAAVAITNSRFVRTSAAGGLNLVELY